MERRVRLALGILIILLMSPWSSMVDPETDEKQRLDDERDVEFFSIRTDAYSDFVGTYASSDVEEERLIRRRVTHWDVLKQWLGTSSPNLQRSTRAKIGRSTAPCR